VLRPTLSAQRWPALLRLRQDTSGAAVPPPPLTPSLTCARALSLTPSQDKDWVPTITVKQVLLGIQECVSRRTSPPRALLRAVLREPSTHLARLARLARRARHAHAHRYRAASLLTRTRPARVHLPAPIPRSLLDNPNLGDPAQREAFIMLRDDRAGYIERVKQLAKSYDPKAAGSGGS
jgi:hypothetical protein